MASISAAAVLSMIFLFFLIFGLAGTVDTSAFFGKFGPGGRRSIAVGILCQFFVLPLLGFAATQVFDIGVVKAVMLMITTSSPGGSYSNWWCSLCNADLALSVAMTTISSVACAFMLPFNLFIYVGLFYSRRVPIDWSSLAASIVLVVAAILSGLFAGHRLPGHHTKFNLMGNVFGVALIALGFFVNASGGAPPFWRQDAVVFGAVISPCALGLMLSCTFALLLGRPKPEVVAIAIETCFQNTAIALTVALSTFSTDVLRAEATGIPIVYQFTQVSLLALFGLISWQLGWTHTPRNANFVRCVSGNFQPTVEGAPAASELEAAPPEAPAGAAVGSTIPLSTSQVGVTVVEVAGAPAVEAKSRDGSTESASDLLSWLRQAVGIGGTAAPASTRSASASAARPVPAGAAATQR